MVVGICKIALYIPECHSLKEKRGIVRKIKARTSNEFKVAVAEVGSNDMWQRAELGFAVVGNDRRLVEAIVQRMTDFIENMGLAQIVDQYSEMINI